MLKNLSSAAVMIGALMVKKHFLYLGEFKKQALYNKFCELQTN